MQHKINQKLSPDIKQEQNPTQHVKNLTNNLSPDTQTHQFKDFLKTSVRRPEVSPDFIQNIMKNIHQE